MSPQPESSSQEVLAGLVERVTYHNAENGFCVLRAKARGHRDVVTVVGHAPTIAAGEWITASGEWVNDRTHGQQFKARFLRTSPPTSADGIEKYLASGMIRGVGPAYAKKLLRAFGEKVFDIIEATPDRLREGRRHRAGTSRSHHRGLGRAEGGAGTRKPDDTAAERRSISASRNALAINVFLKAAMTSPRG
jgi:ATP-dependent exoDNAse (exonuclease V) alpha subunit